MLFKETQSLGVFQGSIMRILETRVKRALTKELVEYGMYIEAQNLLKQFHYDDHAIIGSDRSQNVFLNQLAKLEKPETEFLSAVIENLFKDAAEAEDNNEQQIAQE